MKKTFIKEGIFTIFATLFCVISSFAQTDITTGALTPTSVCAGGNVSVAFTYNGAVLPTNSFVAQLSDAAGAFTSAVNIGSGTSSPIAAVIPSGTAAAATYKIRVVSVVTAVPTVPVIIGSSSAALTVNAIPAAPTVTTPVNYNVGATATALTATGSGLKWYTVETLGTALGGAPTPLTTAAGTTSYYVSQTTSGCESPRAKIDVVVTCATPAPTVTTPVNYNVGATATALTATGTGLKWYTVETAGTALGGAPTPGTTSADIGTKSWWVSQTLNGCEGSRAKIDVVVTCATPAPTATSPVNYTVGATATALVATGTALKWYDVPNNGTALAGAPTPSTASVGTVSYYVSQTVNGCEGPRAKIDVIVGACTTPAPTATSPINYNVGATATALVATGTALKWYTVVSAGTPLGAAPTPGTTASDIGTKSWWVSQTLNGCEGPRTQIDVVVTCATPAPTVTTPVNYNVGATAVDLTASGTGLKWYDVPTNGTALAAAPTPATNAAAIGTKSYYVSQTLNGCEGPRAKIDVVVTCATPAPTVTTPVNYNVGATPVALTATGTGLKWYTVETAGTALGGAPTPTVASAGTTSYYVSQTLNGCEGPRAKIDVVVSCGTPAPTVTTPVNYTVGATSTALVATGAALKWYDVPTNGTALAGAPTPSTASAGTVSYYVSQTLNGCEGPRAKIDVVVAACATPAPTVTSPVNYTVGAAATPLVATGTALKWYDVPTNGTALGGAPTPLTTAAAIGTKSYYVSQTLNGCEGPRAKIDVVVTCATAAPTVTTPVTYNVGAVATDLTATGSGLKWYTVESGGVALANAPTPLTTSAAIGTTSYYVSQTVNGCEGPRAKIDVVVNCGTPAPTTSPVNYCLGAPAVVVTATGTNLKWYTVQTGGTALASAPIPATNVTGTITYYVSQTLNNCEGARAALVVTVTQLSAPTVADIEYCSGTTASALTATGTSLKWYTAATGGTLLAAAPVPSTTTAGVTSYFVSQTNVSGCESTRAEIKVTIKSTPAAPSVTNVSYCKNAPAVALIATPSSGGTLNWYGTNQTGGTASNSAPTPGTSDGVPYYVSQTATNGCESPRATLTVTIKPIPAAPGVSGTLVEYCQFVQSAPLTATFANNASPNWFGTAASGGTSSPNAPSPSTQDGGTTSYYVAQTLDGCIGDRAKIDVLIKTTPKPVTTTYFAFCQGATASALSATGTNLKWYRDATTSQANALIPFTEKVEDYSFYVTQTGSNGCESPKEEIKIHIKGLPSATISGNTSIAFGETATIRLAFTSDGPWKYVLSNGLTGTSDNSTLDVPVKPTTTTTYLVTEVSNACGKGIPIGSALVTVRVPTISSGNPSFAEACAGKSFQVPFQQSGNFPADFTFKVQVSTVNEDAKFVNIPSVATVNQVTATLPDTLKGGVYFIRVVSSGANSDLVIKGSTANITLTVNPLPAGVISGSKTILFGDNADIKIDFMGKAPWTFNLNNGTKDSSITATLTPYTILLKPKVTTTYTINSIVNVCGTVAKGTGSARIQVDPILGVEPPSVTFVNVYPTIVDAKCIVELDEPVSAKQSGIELIDLSGRTIKTTRIKQKVTEVDLSDYPGGLYLIRVQNGNHTSVHRVLKQ
jgi:hypothetical protein